MLNDDGASRRIVEVRAAMARWAAEEAEFHWWLTATVERFAADAYVERAMKWFVGRVAERAGRPVPYLWVRERGERFGRPHGHVLLGGAPGITRSWLERALGKWWNVRVDPYRKNGGAEGYVVKQLDWDEFEYDFWFGDSEPEVAAALAERPKRWRRGGRDRRHPWRRRRSCERVPHAKPGAEEGGAA